MKERKQSDEREGSWPMIEDNTIMVDIAPLEMGKVISKVQEKGRGSAALPRLKLAGSLLMLSMVSLMAGAPGAPTVGCIEFETFKFQSF
jgi:hypothetical protein